MESIILNTETLKQKSEEIGELKTFFDNNKEKFLKYRYSDNLMLSNSLNKIYGTFEDVSDNLCTVMSIIRDYYQDIEYLENSFYDEEQLIIKNVDDNI